MCVLIKMLVCRAFFPLTGSPATYPALATYPVPQYSGYGLNAVPVADDLFGGAIQCVRDLEAEVELDTVPYATSGAFTVNIWFQAGLPQHMLWCPGNRDCQQIAIKLL